MARRFYVDTSAYLCVLLGEAGHESLQRELAGAELLSSVLLVLESGRNLVQLSREGVLTAAEFQHCVGTLENDMRQFLLRDLTLDLCVTGTMPVVSTPRSLDEEQTFSARELSAMVSSVFQRLSAGRGCLPAER